ncbi:Activator of 90 kDa heat shock protein ATPase -like protein 1 [Toxocara canis]|uniref:Activator of 90 kDa heat shock protein ATPase-like protein 1 n=1 Tax=Toxocara canis TaxID=6265 RepID=A0A0B2UYB5_TOXCA|nr:Activator of 90 kDa heat shock protein ATPase -like protein 1 [Toxocara canis]
MAKWGEGDPRWIVEERPDAVNVNNWHWTEKNATPWSKERLKELLVSKTVEKGPIFVQFGEFSKIEGEATANNRKAKLIFLFEWNIELSFTVKVAGSDIEYKGHIEIPNLSDENEADEVDVTLSLDTAGPHDAEIRHLFNNEVTAFVRKQMAVYIRELKEEFSKGLILPTDRSKPQVITKGKTNIAHPTVDKKAFQNHEQNKELDMKWRLKSYPSGHYANMRFILEDEGDSTKIRVEATGVPRGQRDDTENGIRRYYLQSISRTFGFGAHIF